MIATDDQTTDQRRLWFRFWASASGFWCGPVAWTAWVLAGSLVVIVLLQLYVQYQFNYWNRDFFDALERETPTLCDSKHGCWCRCAHRVSLWPSFRFGVG